MSYLLVIAIMSAVTYRISRFIVLDTLIEGVRDKLVDWLERHPRFFWTKFKELIGCPYCVTIWISAVVVWAQNVFVAPVELPIWAWLSVATGSVMIWSFVDSEET